MGRLKLTHVICSTPQSDRNTTSGPRLQRRPPVTLWWLTLSPDVYDRDVNHVCKTFYRRNLVTITYTTFTPTHGRCGSERMGYPLRSTKDPHEGVEGILPCLAATAGDKMTDGRTDAHACLRTTGAIPMLARSVVSSSSISR